MSIKKFSTPILLVTTTVILNACIYQTLSNSVPQSVLRNSPRPSASILRTKDANPGLEMIVEQKKNNGEIISIGSKGIQSVLIDEIDYPVDKLVKNEFKIEIPNLIPGKHKLKMSLYLVKTTFTIPLIIPNLKIDTVPLLLKVNIDEQKREIQKVEYGYDFDRNGTIDINVERFESDTGLKNFFLIYPNNTKEKVNLNINTAQALPSEQLPPGVIPNSVQQKVDTSLPLVQIPEPPKPKLNDSSLYPLPPSLNKEPVSIPSEKAIVPEVPAGSPSIPPIDIQEIP